MKEKFYLIYVHQYADVCKGCGVVKELVGIATNEDTIETIKNNYNKIFRKDFVGHYIKNNSCVFEIVEFDNIYNNQTEVES